MKIKSSKIFLFLKLGIGIAVVIFLLFWFKVDVVLHTIEKIDLRAIIILFFIYISDRLLMAYKWGLLVKSFKEDIGFWNLAKAYFYGSFASQFMPISISGDLVRFYSVSGDDLSRTYLFSSMVIEKMFGFFSMIVAVILSIALYSSPLNNEHFYNGIFITIVSLIVISFILFYIFKTKIISNLIEKYSGRFKQKILDIISSFKFYSEKKGLLIKFFIYSLIEQVFPIIAVLILSNSLGIDISVLQVIFVTTLGLLLARLPISPGSIGVQEGAFVGLFILIGLDGEVGFALSISMRILDMIYPLPFILVYLSETVQLIRKSKSKESLFT